MNTNREQRKAAAHTVTLVGMGAMVVLSLTQPFPAVAMAGVAVWVGLACFFVVEALAGASGDESNLRFRTMGRELKDRAVWRLTLLLVGVQVLSVAVGTALFGEAFVAYDLGRALDVTGQQSVIDLLLLLPLSGWGEEIAWRGFFLGKKRKGTPFWAWALFSSALFAMGHFSQHAIPLVLFGIGCNFVCSLILCCIFRRTKNCMTSTVAHVVGNYAEVLCVLLV